MTAPVVVDPATFAPSSDEVWALLVARGELDETSSPTLDQVQSLIDGTAAELAGELSVLPAQLVGLATATVKYKVAADVEASGWPEQQMGASAAGGIWYARYVQAHDRLVALAGEYGDTPSTAKSVFAPSGTALAAAALLANDALAPYSVLPDWYPEF